MTIAITGANGQLGSELCRQLGSEATPLTRPDFDLMSRNAIERALYTIQPRAVINAAAYTQVDKAEIEVEKCWRVNAQAVAILAEVCLEMNCPLVHISPDYVFGAGSYEGIPRLETDETSPQGEYAKSKLAGEKYAATWSKHFVVRTCGLYSVSDQGPIRGRNFVDTMLALAADRDQLSVVNDQHCTPTFVPHLAEAICHLLSTDDYGTYHVTNTGATTWFDFAQEIFRLADIDIQLDAITTEQFNAPAPRPRFSVLNTSKYHKTSGPELPPWQAGLREYFELSRTPALTSASH